MATRQEPRIIGGGVQLVDVEISDEQIAREQNHSVLMERTRQAFQLNQQFLALPTPNAGQNAAQIQRLTKEMNVVLRLLLGADDSVADT